MPIDDDTWHDIKWAFVWAVSIIAVFLLALYILGKVYPQAETGERYINDTLRIHPHILSFFVEDLDSTGNTDTMQLWYEDTLSLSIDTMIFELPPLQPFYDIPFFKPKIIYPEPEPKIIKIQRRIKNARSTGIQWE